MIGADELIFNNDNENGIHTGGFSVKSIMMKEGISPIMTLNGSQKGGTNQVSDLFNNLVVPSWILSYHNKMGGSKIKEERNRKEDSDDSDSESDIIDDDLHDKLLDLVRQHDIQEEKKKKKNTRKKMNKKGGTKKRKKGKLL
jgi:hypothetical protein